MRYHPRRTRVGAASTCERRAQRLGMVTLAAAVNGRFLRCRKFLGEPRPSVYIRGHGGRADAHSRCGAGDVAR